MELFEVAVLRKVGEEVILELAPIPIMAKNAKAAEYKALLMVNFAECADDIEVRVRPFVGA